MKIRKISQKPDLYTEYNDWVDKQPKTAPEVPQIDNLGHSVIDLNGVCIYCGGKGYFHTKFSNVQVCQTCLRSGKLG